MCVPAVALIVKVPQFAAKSRAPRQLHFSIKHGVKQTLHINKYSKSTPPSASYFSALHERECSSRTAHTNKHSSRERAAGAAAAAVYNLLLRAIPLVQNTSARSQQQAACAQPKQIKAARS
jgi:hypothetical protein